MDTGDGPTYRLVWAVYLTALVGAVALAAFLTRTPTGDAVAMAVIFGGSGLLALVGTVLGLRGVPRPLAPRPLYASRLRLLPMAVGVVAALASLGLLLTDTGPVPSASLLALLFGGVLLAAAGGVVALLATNAEARARLDGVDPIEWRARPDRRRRRTWHGVAVAMFAALVALAAVTRDFFHVSLLGYPVVAWVQAENEHTYWLTDGELVFGNTTAYRILDRRDITNVRHTDDSIRIERRGWRPALTCDTAGIADPERVREALR
ncbi:hypothetical protein [Halosegnis longus]|uniref:PH domain-containing protein n=1 Tax=Halosegnis longus TaxID=2216012 RepID=A0AAJ4RA48_9EURY|nr:MULTISPECIES: hypothetical protein [Halobacteriales]RNJ27042.1 hypothetical protein Nmn1133_10360 [Salella cibi]